MAIRPFSEEEFQKIKETNLFKTEELISLKTGNGLALALYIRARSVLGDHPMITLQAELQEVMNKVFLMFTVLERKNLISIQEMADMAKTLEKEFSDAGKQETEAGSTSAGP